MSFPPELKKEISKARKDGDSPGWMKRQAGVLMPVFSLPSPHGIGCFDKEARHFIDMLALSGQSCWQILPLNPAGDYDSPYQPRTCFGGDPIYIDPEQLLEGGLVTEEEMEKMDQIIASSGGAQSAEDNVNYKAVRKGRDYVFRKAFSRFIPDGPFNAFLKANKFWLDDYALFQTIADFTGSYAWNQWPSGLRFRRAKALKDFETSHKQELEYVKWLQFLFFTQWKKIMEYSHSRGISIVGDIPIYASFESADCWASPELFQLDENRIPENVAGAPPDGFSPDGQVWGNPLYHWEVHKAQGYSWWISRIRHNLQQFDILRLDHTRGFSSYFSIPADKGIASEGQWEKGPGTDFFRHLHQALGDTALIAEDLGFITEDVKEMVEDAGLPGMKVLQFAFDGDPHNPYLPENIPVNSVVYTGTHDNDTTAGWYDQLDHNGKKFVTRWLRQGQGIHESQNCRAPFFSPRSVAAAMVQRALMSKAFLCIIPIGDYLLLGTEGRINTPGTVGINWSWRMNRSLFTEDLARSIARLAKQSGRSRK